MKRAITPGDLEDLFEEAARTLRRLPNPPGSGPKGYGSGWPDYVQEIKHAYGYHDVRMRVIPSATDIASMEECLTWLRQHGRMPDLAAAGLAGWCQDHLVAGRGASLALCVHSGRVRASDRLATLGCGAADNCE